MKLLSKIFLMSLVLYFQQGSMKLYAQFTNKIWCFGDSVGINFNLPVSFFQCGTAFLGGTASIADSNGQILFYGSTSNETNSHSGQLKEGKLFNRIHNKLFNGDTLVGGEWYHDMIIIPKSVTDSTFYVFIAGVTVPDTGLWYNVVDLKLQGGLGEVVQKNVQLETHPVQDMLAAVKHGNGRDWWLVTRRVTYAPGYVKNNDFFVYRIDSLGIHPKVVQHVGTSHYDNGGDISFNLTGSQFVLSGLGSYLGIFNFNRCTGIISNEQIAEQYAPPSSIFKYYHSSVISPNGQLLYALSNQQQYNAASKLYQFDLTAASIPNSRVLIDSFTLDAGPAGMELAPDGKIYISSAYVGVGSGWPYPNTCWNYINQNLSVINQPDSLGLACDFQPFSFYLGGARTYYGLPNNPNYELGAWVGSPCDTLSVGLPQPTTPAAPFFQAWYNHEWDMIHVNASGLKGSKGSLRLVDMDGRIIYEKNIVVIAGGYVATEIPTINFASGIYIVSLVTEKDLVSEKIRK